MILTAMFLAAVLMTAFVFLSTTVPPGHFGVRQVLVPPFAGYGTEGLTPGRYWSIPRILVVHSLPMTLNLAAVSDAEIPLAGRGRNVSLGVRALYRLYQRRAEDHGGPAELITRVGLQPESWAGQVRQAALPVLASPFPTVMELHGWGSAIGGKLKELGIGVEGVLIDQLRYEPGAEATVLQRGQQELDARVEAARAQLDGLRRAQEDLLSKHGNDLQRVRLEAEERERVLVAEGEALLRQRTAEGDLLAAKAVAEIDRARNELLTKSPGANVYLAEKLVPMITSLRGGVVSGLNVFDTEQWLESLGVPKESR